MSDVFCDNALPRQPYHVLLRLTIFLKNYYAVFQNSKLNMHVLLCQVLNLVIVKTVKFHIMLVLINFTIII